MKARTCRDHNGWSFLLCMVVSLSTTTTAARAFARSPPPTHPSLVQHQHRRVLLRHSQQHHTVPLIPSSSNNSPAASASASASLQALVLVRGGQQNDTSETTTTTTTTLTSSSSPLAMVMSTLTAFGKYYASSLESRPILTKSVTACGIFAISDLLAQKFEASSAHAADTKNNKQLQSSSSSSLNNWTRTISAALVGLLYFGPAAHYWYETIFRLLPGTTLVSIFKKAVLGQLLFGPSFTCIFFATGLLQAGTFSLGNWLQKIRQDLPGAWLAGAGYWPLVDLVSYSLVPKDWIPLFVNMCSLVWTIYLSVVANRGSTSSSSSRTE